MKQLILLTLFIGSQMILTTQTGFGQESISLSGTTKLPSTRGQLNARLFDVCLDHVLKSECGANANDISVQNRIIEILKSDSALSIRLKTASNCCYDFLCDIDVYNDSTLNIIYHPYGQSHCACSCEFELTFELLFNCLSNDGRGNHLKALVINGDPKSMKTIK